MGKTGCCGSLLDSWLWYVCKGQMKAECEIRVYYTSVCSDVMDDSDLSFDVSCDAVPTSERVFLSWRSARLCCSRYQKAAVGEPDISHYDFIISWQKRNDNRLWQVCSINHLALPTPPTDGPGLGPDCSQDMVSQQLTFFLLHSGVTHCWFKKKTKIIIKKQSSGNNDLKQLPQ